MILSVRITLIFGLLTATCAVPLILYKPVFWPTALKFLIVISLIFYGVLLCLWSKTPVKKMVLPVLLVTCLGTWAETGTWFIIMGLGVFCWIRSGICFNDRLFRSRVLVAEIITIAAGAGYLLFWQPRLTYALPLVIWFFFLVQSLYFYIVLDNTVNLKKKDTDSFERARREIERILRTGRAGL